MSASRIEYLQRFLDHTDFVISGRRNAISEDRWLVGNYDPSFYSIVDKHLRNTDARVRADVINLLAAVKERRALTIIKEMRASDKEIVQIACLGYLKTIGESDTMIPELFDILEHRNGPEFSRAAARIAAVGRSEDVPRLRRTYGQVSGEMREEAKKALTAIIDRDPSLSANRRLLLTVPVFPDEERFLRFLDSSITYLDIRYRDSVAPSTTVSLKVYNNVYGSIMRMRERLFNEFDNLRYYGKECSRMYDELVHLMEWASQDLSGKTAEGAGNKLCSGCGEEMRFFSDTWVCVDCGTKKRP